MKKLIVFTACLLLVPAMASGQAAHSKYLAQGYLFLGLGEGNGHFMLHGGGGGEAFLYKGLGLGAEADYGHGKGAGWGNSMWIGSGNLTYHFGRKGARGKADPFVAVGPSGFFPTSEGRGALAVNFGAGVNLWLRQSMGLRLEVRDFVNAGRGPNDWPDHAVAFRVGITFR
jgi:hypothetical protein